jgi:DNA polymerase-3 subunit delta'
MNGTLEEPDRLDGYPHPREARELIGHREGLAAIADGLAVGRLHHGWLIGGLEGIGKATFAYQIAKHLLSPPPQRALDAEALARDPGTPAARLVAQLAHPDLVTLRRVHLPDKAKPTTEIPTASVRRAIDMFESTAGGGQWRVCIVDSAEDLNAAGANALLKMLEEPPARALFLIVSHQPRRLLPTIRSRCRALTLQPLPGDELDAALRTLAPEASPERLAQAAAMAGGSVRRALTRLNPETAALVLGTRSLLDALPRIDPKAVAGLADQLTHRTGEAAFEIFRETLEEWASDALHAHVSAGGARLAPLAEVWDKTARAIRETDALNLDRRPLVMSIFQDLARAVVRMRAN